MSVPALRIVHAPSVSAASVAILPGGFNPPSRAHLALAQSALTIVDAVWFVLPRRFPHKGYEGASFDQRLAMLSQLVSMNSRFGLGVSEGGLYIEIVREIKAALSVATIHALCGRDAAERIVSWDYGTPNAIEAMLEEFGLLVAARRGEYQAPEHLRHAIASLPFGDYDDCSSTLLRKALADRSEWKHLAPAEIHDQIEAIYSAPLNSRKGRNR